MQVASYYLDIVKDLYLDIKFSNHIMVVLGNLLYNLNGNHP
jgi:hypothetical protein